MNLNDLNILTSSALAAPAANTATLTGAAFDLQSYEGVVKITQEIGVASGTNPTWDGKIQDSADGSTGWADVTGATFTQATASTNSQSIGVDTRLARRYIRYVGTLGGTSTPTFNLAVEIVGMKRRLGSL